MNLELLKQYIIENSEYLNFGKIEMQAQAYRGNIHDFLYRHGKLNQNIIDILYQIGYRENDLPEDLIDKIQRVVCNYFNVPIELLQSGTRKREIVQARQIGMFFCKNLTKFSEEHIGNKFGGFDHSSVNHSRKKVNIFMDTEPRYKQQIEEIEKEIEKVLK